MNENIEDKIKAECTRLWKEAFKDSDEFISQFIEHHYCEENMLYIENDGKLSSMLHTIPFELNGAPVAYIYAVATDRKERGKGHATKLIQKAIEKAKKEGYKAIITLPASKGLKKFYSCFGFKGEYAVKFETPDNFDFGTGESKKDIATAIILDNDMQLPAIFNLKK